MKNNLPAFVKQPRFVEGAIAGAAAGAAAFIAAGNLSFMIPHGATDALPASVHLKHWALIGLSGIGVKTHAAALYQDWLADLSRYGLSWQIETRMYTSSFAGLLSAAWAAWEVGKPRDSRIKKEGGKLIQGEDIYRFGKRGSLFNRKPRGINLLPNFFVSEDKIREHLMVIAGTGAGKSSAIMPLMIEAKNRGDRALIFDFKGITEKWPGRVYKDRGVGKKSTDTVILAPWDQRSVKWAISRDIDSTMAAQDFAARMIPESKEPVFSQGARQIFTGLIVKLIRENPRKWGFADLARLLSLDQSQVIEIMRAHYPQALSAANAAPVTYSGISLNLAAFTGIIIDLAGVWPEAGGFSVKEWVLNRNHQIRTVLLKTSTQFSTLSSAINGTILGVLCSMITSMPDVEAGDAPIWLWLDEFSVLGKVQGWQEMVVTGRSKDFRIIMNAQSKSQYVETWGQHVAQTWIDAVGIKLLGKNDGEGAEFASEIIGTASYSTPTYSTDSNGRRLVNWSAAQEEPLFSKTRVQTELGQGRFVVHGIKGVELLVRFPNMFSKMPLLRAADIPSSICFAPHPISQSPTEPPAAPPPDSPPVPPLVATAPAPALAPASAPEVAEKTSDAPFDLVALTIQKLEEESVKEECEVVSDVAEDVASKVVGQLLGSETVEVFEAGMHFLDTMEAISQPKSSGGTQQVSARDRIALLKQRKKQKAQDLEQSI